MATMPRWFCALFVAVMFVLCGFLCYFAAVQYDLHFQVADLTLSLDTSRQREVKQQHEYDEVVAALPLVQEQVGEVQPAADEALARVAELKELRKTLRGDAADLQDRLDDLYARVEALRKRLKTLSGDE